MRRLAGILALTGLMTGFGFAPEDATAQSFPTRAVTLVAPYPPGAVTDLVARILQQKMGEILGQPVVVENRPGSGGNTGTAYVARAKADGYTLLVTVNPPINTSPFLYKSLPYQPEKDLTGVSLLGETYLSLVVKKSSPLNTVQDIIEEAKKRPGQMTYGSAGIGSAHQLAGELLNKNAGIQINHIPYQGGAPAIQAAAAGQIDMSYGTLPAVMPFVERGDLKIVALAESKRFQDMPNVPTVAETVPGVETSTWIGLLAPAGTPQDVIDRIYAAAKEAISTPDAQAKLKAAGLLPVVSTPGEFNQRIAADLKFFGEAIKKTGIEAQ